MDGGTSFTIALVTSYNPVAVTFQDFDLGPDSGPDALFDDAHAPRGREYPFDLTEADHQVHVAGYEMTASWRWAGTGRGWAAVVQPQTDYFGHDEDLARRETKPWEQGGYEG